MNRDTLKQIMIDQKESYLNNPLIPRKYFLEENVAYLVLVQWWGDDRQVSQSGKPLCTGASLWAVPKLAMGVCPLEPRHANGDNSVLEISTGYFFSDCHGLAKTLSCIYQRGTLHIPLWNPLLI